MSEGDEESGVGEEERRAWFPLRLQHMSFTASYICFLRLKPKRGSDKVTVLTLQCGPHKDDRALDTKWILGKYEQLKFTFKERDPKILKNSSRSSVASFLEKMIRPLKKLNTQRLLFTLALSICSLILQLN